MQSWNFFLGGVGGSGAIYSWHCWHFVHLTTIQLFRVSWCSQGQCTYMQDVLLLVTDYVRILVHVQNILWSFNICWWPEEGNEVSVNSIVYLRIYIHWHQVFVTLNTDGGMLVSRGYQVYNCVMLLCKYYWSTSVCILIW